MKIENKVTIIVGTGQNLRLEFLFTPTVESDVAPALICDIDIISCRRGEY